MRVILEQSAKKTIMRKFIAFLLIIALTMVNFILLGMEIVSYAANAIMEGTVTNNRNITFDTYFKDINGNKVTDKSESIDSNDMKLYIQLAVRNEGYFNGTVTLGTANFKLKNEVLSNYINKIEGNTVTLNQINSGETVELELGIEVIKEDTISSGLLNMESEISVNGTYRDSTEKDIDISATRKVKLELVSPYEGTELRSSILTNNVYEVNGKNKRIVQVLVESGLEGNRYPVKENMVEVSVPNGVEEVEVMARGMLATNGQEEIEFGKKDWEYSEKEQKVKIEIKNEVKNGTIKWLKNGKDRIVVTYVMNEETNITGKDIVATSKITMYDAEGTVKEGSQSVKVSEELDGVIGAEIEVGEDSIYKGKIYSGENREYNETVKIYANTNKAGKKVEVETGEATYEVAGGEAKGNIQILKTVINKAKVMRILGTEGSLTIKAGENTVKTINKDTETDENGNVVINHVEGTKTIKVETTEAKEAGTIELNNTKVIKQDGNSKELKRAYTGIKERVTGAEGRIELKDTETKAEIAVNKERLSALSKNENVEITATLRTDNEKYDLFKNPTFEIVMPESIKEMNIKTLQPLYADMFRVAEATIADGENGTRIIRVALEGEQTSHTTEVNQTTIVMVADIEFEELTPSKETVIKMNYTNENGVTGSYSEVKGIKVESKYGLMMNTTMEGYNDNGEKISTMDDEVAKGKLEIKDTKKIAKVKELVINNYDENMKNVEIIGRIPTEGINEGTINTKLVGDVKTTVEGAEILYSTDADAKPEDNVWQPDSNEAKVFKIKIGEIEKGSKVEAEYEFEIPENLNYGEKVYSKIETVYAYLGKVMEQTSVVGAETELLTNVETAGLENTIETNLDNGLAVNIGATTAGRELKDGESVYEGQAIEYTVYITNNTGNDLKNVNISVEQQNGTMYGLKEFEVENIVVYHDTEKHIEHRYEELDTNKKELKTLENFSAGQTLYFKYEIIVNEVQESSTINGQIKIKTDELDETTASTISNKIEQAELKINYKYYRFEEAKLYYGSTLETMLTVQNLTNEQLTNVKGKILLPKETYVTENIYSDLTENEKISNVKYNEAENSITFDILEINPGEENQIIGIFYIEVKEFSQSDINLTFLANATIGEKTYYSNQMTKNYNNVLKNVSINQESNLEEDKILQDDDEFSIAITAKNNNQVPVFTTINDELPECFEITSAHIETSNGIENLKIIDENENSENNETSYIMKDPTYGSVMYINRELKGNEEIKIILNIKVSINVKEEHVTNKAIMEYGETEEDGREKYVVKQESEKIYNIKQLDAVETVNYIEVKQTSNIENKSTLTDGQEIVYLATIENISDVPTEISITDYLPKGIVAKQAQLGKKDIEIDNNSIEIDNITLNNGQKIELKITANYEQGKAEKEELINIINIETLEDIVKSNEITYFAKIEDEFDEEDSDDGNIDDEDEDEDEGDDQDENTENEYNTDDGESNGDNSNGSYSRPKGTYEISGVAWLDKNKDGKRDDNEAMIKGLQVKIINTDTGKFVQKDGEDVSTTTDSNGQYTFYVSSGNYIVVFMYDNTKYGVTQYKKQGIDSDKNSDVINKTIQIDGNSYEVASTDSLKLTEDIKNIDMGLIENSKFDLELNKYVSEITVSTSKSTNKYNYENAKLAKAEIHAKELNSANVVIKYQIEVKNTGEIPGYVKDIVDYLPSSLTFNSELNTEWYQSDKNLHYTHLANTKINAGETKVITLVLTKKMTESNTGLVSNLAELAETNNDLSAKDIDSVANNKAQNEDDLGKADVIISVKTGALIMYVSIIIAILTVIFIGAYLVNEKVLKKYDEEY